MTQPSEEAIRKAYKEAGISDIGILALKRDVARNKGSWALSLVKALARRIEAEREAVPVARATAAEAREAALLRFADAFASQPCSCGVMHGAVLCAPCRARAAIEETSRVG